MDIRAALDPDALVLVHLHKAYGKWSVTQEKRDLGACDSRPSMLPEQAFKSVFGAAFDITEVIHTECDVPAVVEMGDGWYSKKFPKALREILIDKDQSLGLCFNSKVSQESKLSRCRGFRDFTLHQQGLSIPEAGPQEEDDENQDSDEFGDSSPQSSSGSVTNRSSKSKVSSNFMFFR